MKKILVLILVFVMSVLAFVSCGGGNKPSGGNTTGGTQQQTPPPVNTTKGWTSGVVYYRGDGFMPVDTIANRFILENTNVLFSPEGGDEKERLFIVGKCEEPLSEIAYETLEKAFSGEEGNTIFVIYTDGKSIAIAYDSTVALYAAMEYFFDEIKNLDLSKKAPIVIKEFEIDEYVEAEHQKQREAALAALEGKLSAEAVTQLKKLYGFYDLDVYMWLANLWDPDIGGFYYSNSARDTEGFLPDLESTYQAMKFMTDSGMLVDYKDSFNVAFSDEVTESIVSFVKELQSSTDGYFYHPQWGNSISATRKGRDLGWAKRILNALGARPYWNTPDGVRGELGAPGVSDVVTSSFTTSKVVAASQVITTATPSYLSSVENFKAYLNNPLYFNWETDSYAAGNRLESELGQIQAKGTAYTDALIEFLDSKQKDNGLWENRITYDSVNGLMKISVVYTSLGKVIPRVEKAMDSAIVMLKSTDTAAHVCSVYNPWEAVANILVSVEKVSGKAKTDELRSAFRDEAAELIKVTYDKLSVFKKADGGFSYYIKYSSPSAQGSPVALPNSAESDVNATMICVNSIITAMFNVLGVDEVERYYSVDFAYIHDVIDYLGTIVKDDIPPAEAEIFDEYDPNYGEEVSGVVTFPADNAQNVVGDDEGFEQGEYKWFQSSIVKNPAPKAAASDLVLHVQSKVYPELHESGGKTLADAPSSTRFNIPNVQIASLGDTYVFDADMYFVSGYGKTNHTGAATKDPIMQLFFMTEALTCASVNFSVYTENGVDYVKIGENFAGLDGKDANVAGGIPMDQWVNIRIEFYKRYVAAADGINTEYKPILKVYVDGKYWGECDANVTGTENGKVVYYDRKVSLVSLSYYRFLASEIYLNNVLVERCNLEYVHEINPDAIVDPALPDEPMRESYGFEDGLLNTSNVANKVRVLHFGTEKYINAVAGQTHNPYISYSIVGDPTGAANKVLKVVATKSTVFEKPSRTEVNLYNSAADGTDYTFSGKFYYPAAEIGAAGALTELVIFNSLENVAYKLVINAVKTEGAPTTISIAEANNRTGNGNDTTTKTLFTNIACDEWFTIKVVFHKTAEVTGLGADVYVNDQKVADKTYQDAAKAQYPIMKTLITHQRTNTSTVYLDDLSFARSGNKIEYTESTEREASFTTGYDTKYIHSFTFDGTEELSVPDIDPNTMETLYTKFYLYADPKDASNQVLRAVNKKGGTNAGYTRLDFCNESPIGGCYTFQTKMYMEVCDANYVFACLRFMNTNDEAVLNLNLSLDKDTTSFKVATTSSGVSPAAGTNLLSGMDRKIGKGVWFNLKIEFYYQGSNATKENTFLKIYIDDAEVYSGAVYHKFGAPISYLKLEHSKTDRSSAILYDNMSFTRTNKAYVD